MTPEQRLTAGALVLLAAAQRVADEDAAAQDEPLAA